MKWRSLCFLLTCLLMENLVSGEDIKGEVKMKKTSDGISLSCHGGKFLSKNGQIDELTLPYEDVFSHYNCLDPKNVTLLRMTVKIRTCENCIQLDAPSLSAVIVGNILATFFVAFAVYSVTGHSKGKTFSGKKASDKVTLLNSSNGETDTYQPLNPGQSSEYSKLGGVRRN